MYGVRCIQKLRPFQALGFRLYAGGDGGEIGNFLVPSLKIVPKYVKLVPNIKVITQNILGITQNILGITQNILGTAQNSFASFCLFFF